MSEAVVLLGHGARDPEWAGPMTRLAGEVERLAPGCVVRLAFLEFMQPDLAGAVTAVVEQGALAVVVVPVFLAQGGHVRRDVPVVLEGLRARFPGVSIRLAPVLGERAEVIEAMARVVVAGG